MPKRKTTEEFKNELKTIMPNLEVVGEYNGDKNYITVRCVKHDYTFNSKPVWLRHNHGCQKCYDERRGASRRRDLNDIISKAKIVHDNKYDYSKITSYKNGHTKVPIICPQHGEFLMTINHHLSGQGCPKCAGKYKTTEEVINQFKEVHGSTYDYSKVEYFKNKTKVCIICPKHGEFLQTPDNHLEGKGCPKCKASKLERTIRGFLSENNIEFLEQKKFDWLGKQSLDFYLPKYKVGIECQGEQHFKEYSGNIIPKQNITERIKLDITKNQLCSENNVKLIYFTQKRWKNKFANKCFNNIYTNKNTIFDKEIEKIKNILNS